MSLVIFVCNTAGSVPSFVFTIDILLALKVCSAKEVAIFMCIIAMSKAEIYQLPQTAHK